MEIKNALITGAASGMGKITAKRLAADGVHVAAVDVNEENLNQLKQESNNISIFPCDLADSEDVKQMVVEVTNQIGSIDRITHAGAVMPMGSIKDLDSSSINNLMRLNYEGTVKIVSNVFPSMLEQNIGQKILFVSIS